jgi:hypothetical protein
LEQGSLSDFDPEVIRIPKQFEKGKQYCILEFMKLDAKYRTSEFWYNVTKMLKQRKKQKLESIKKGTNNIQ